MGFANDPVTHAHAGWEEFVREAEAPVAVTATCTACGACLLTCPEHALRPTGRHDRPLDVLVTHCTGCLECVEVCPADAIIVANATLDPLSVTAPHAEHMSDSSASARPQQHPRSRRGACP
ncbi:4Fe-4S dicluster domain-containing protein [Salinactinospora qingdaonensis]|uniref:4Fe-4S ferredoxin-type domain-containing protein n=1 Tax=Salinactinospora qingdaonensis TaxID=702744 RepID=A0ABP7EU47_9ACTN